MKSLTPSTDSLTSSPSKKESTEGEKAQLYSGEIQPTLL